jgi:ABC-2 type transport system permease protein
MSTQSNAFGDSALGAEKTAPLSDSPTRPFYWAVRRELWEYRSLYIAPLAVAAIALVAFTLSATAGIWEPPLRLNPYHPGGPFDIADALLMGTGIILTVFYCLDALYGERRDRSILFWKSLPVSDTTTVLAKTSVALLVIPAIVFGLCFALKWLMLLVGSIVVAASGMSVAALWTNVAPVQAMWLLLYHIVTSHLLWAAPVYCWLLLVSAWAKRAPLLWAVLPIAVIGGVERLLFHTHHFAETIGRHFIGDAPAMVQAADDVMPTHSMTHITPGAFLCSPGLWIGLIIAAAFIYAAIRLRRYQGPI